VFTPYPEYANLKTAYTTTVNSTLTYSKFTPSRDSILECPSTISTTLPSMPSGKSTILTAPVHLSNGVS
jgi:hypothetical protein